MSTLIQTFVGNIGIGTNDPGNYKLRVDGEVRANSLEVNGVSNVHVPIGLIAMWYGSVASIPDGWALCDGSSATRTDGAGSITTPNLVNRFVRGADGDAPSPAVPGQTSGANAVAISVQNLPQHAHPFTGSNANAPHNHTTQTAYAPHNHNTSEANAPTLTTHMVPMHSLSQCSWCQCKPLSRVETRIKQKPRLLPTLSWYSECQPPLPVVG